MTDRTMSLIIRFAKTKDISLLPSIIIGIQEDDNIASSIQFKNSLRFFRNLAAHEPEVITTQIEMMRNINTAKLCFIPGDDQLTNRVVIDLTQFTAWMFDAAIRFDNKHYIIFWQTFVSVTCTCFYKREVGFGSTSVNEDKLSWLARFNRYKTEVFRIPNAISLQDPYMINLYKDNQKIFWRMAIPDMMELVAIYLYNVDLLNVDNLKMYIEIFKLREGVE